MKPMRILTWTAILVLPLFASLAQAAGPSYIPPDSVNLLVLLAPPPGPHGPRTSAELGELRHIKAARTPERIALAQADVEESVFRLMTVFDRPPTAKQVPAITALFKKLKADAAVVTDVAKSGFARPRPYAGANDLAPVCPRSASGAYPSSHAAEGYVMGIVLSAMVPEKRDPIFARTEEYAESRLVCGLHHRSDIEAGRIAGTVLAAVAMNNPDFQRDFAVARAELRAALGL